MTRRYTGAHVILGVPGTLMVAGNVPVDQVPGTEMPTELDWVLPPTSIYSKMFSISACH